MRSSAALPSGPAVAVDAAAPDVPAALPGFAALYDLVLALGERRTMRSLRAATVGNALGRTLEIGAGTGLNIPHYPAGVTDLVLTEPDRAMAHRLRRRAGAGGGGAAGGGAAQVIEAGAGALPVPDDAFDTAVSTLVLCTVPDPEAAVAEILRIVRPGGSLLFIEHVRADDPRAARRQHRLERPWAAVAGGCRCTRDTLALLERHFTVTELAHHRWRGMPGIIQPLIAGRAVVPT